MSEKFNVKSINISEKKGEKKEPVETAQIREGHGIEGDAHAGPWLRQVTLLSEEEMKIADAGKGIITYGSFAENLTISGVDLSSVDLLDWFSIGDTVLEVTQIGKECHEMCAVGKAVGDCIMPKLGVFTRVLQGGEIKKGDEGEFVPREFSAMVIVLSDRASAGEYIDQSGPAAVEALEHFFGEWGREFRIVKHIIPDEPDALAKLLEESIVECYDIVVTSGGTGIGPKDITPDVTFEFLSMEVPGIMDFIRNKFGAEFPNALTSRGLAGVMEETLVYNLPGSPKAVKEYLEIILPTIRHSIYMVHGLDKHS